MTGNTNLENLGNLCSLIALLVSFFVVIIGVCNDWNLIQIGGPIVELPLLFLAFGVLFLNEGFQVAIVGTKYFSEQDMEAYPKAKKIRSLIFGVNGEDHLPRMFLGQSLYVVFSTYLISGTTVFVHWPQSVLPDLLTTLLFRSGICGLFICINLFQLLPSTVAQKRPIAFMQNIPTVYTFVKSTLAIESLGILHATFGLVNIVEMTLLRREGLGLYNTALGTFFSYLSACDSDPRSNYDEKGECSDHSNEHSKSEYTDEIVTMTMHSSDNKENNPGSLSTQEASSSLWTWRTTKIVMSSMLCFTAFVYLIVNIAMTNSVIHVNPWVNFAILLVLYMLIFYCEGLKIAIVGTAHMSIEELKSAGYSTKIQAILLHSNSNGDVRLGNGVRRFLLGRQILVVPSNFVVATIFTFHGVMQQDMNSILYIVLVGLALPSVLVTLVFVQLTPQVLAGRYQYDFLNLPGATIVVRLALMAEKLGLTHSAFILCDYLVGYIGNAFDLPHINTGIDSKMDCQNSMLGTRKTYIHSPFTAHQYDTDKTEKDEGNLVTI